MAVSWPCRMSVAAYAAAGMNDVAVPRPACPSCGRPMTFEGSYRRAVREAGVVHAVRVRRAACRPCRASHALLPDFVVHRRRDSVEAIGAAMAAGRESSALTESGSMRCNRNQTSQSGRSAGVLNRSPRPM